MPTDPEDNNQFLAPSNIPETREQEPNFGALINKLRELNQGGQRVVIDLAADPKLGLPEAIIVPTIVSRPTGINESQIHPEGDQPDYNIEPWNDRPYLGRMIEGVPLITPDGIFFLSNRGIVNIVVHGKQRLASPREIRTWSDVLDIPTFEGQMINPRLNQVGTSEWEHRLIQIEYDDYLKPFRNPGKFYLALSPEELRQAVEEAKQKPKGYRTQDYLDILEQ